MFNLQQIVRNNILLLKPYSSARDEFHGEASVFLDANENPYNPPLNRYPDPLQRKLKSRISELKKIAVANIFLGNGSDEPIDLAIRAFCEPGIDNIVAIDPTYGMYAVAAGTNGVEYRKVPLNSYFQLEAQSILDATDSHTKLIFLCSPNNPSGNNLDHQEIEKIINHFSGIVILDEAYIDFSLVPGWLTRLKQYPNLIILQTFSKAWGLAGIRLGMAFADPAIIAIFNKIKYPYNVNILTQTAALEAIKSTSTKRKWVVTLLKERIHLAAALSKLSFVTDVYPSDANFILIRTHNANDIYKYLVRNGIIVRNRSNITLCGECLRVTVGTPDENAILLSALRNFPVVRSSSKK